MMLQIGMAKKKQARDALIERYRGFVEMVARKLIHCLGLPNEQYEEFVAAGYLGLVEAAGRYDKRVGASFKTYAYLRIRGAMIDSIRECSDVSGAGYRYARALQAAQELREDELASELSGKARGRSERLARMLEYAAKSALAFRLSMSDAEHEIVAIMDADDPETNALARERAQIFVSLVATLPKKERMVVEEYYFKGKSFSEVVEAHPGFSKSWVSRLHSRALKLLKVKYEEAMQEALS